LCIFYKSMETIVFESRPMGFQPVVEIAACYLEMEGCLLLLECASFKSEPGKWGVPAGKLEKGESPRQGARRELFEETGITVEEDDLCPLGPLFIRKPKMEYVYHLFHLSFSAKPTVRLSSEHENYLWATKKEIDELPLMAGAIEALHKYRKRALETLK